MFTRSITILELSISLESIWKHLDQRYMALFSRSTVSMVFLLFLNTYLSTVIDLESLWYICMHFMRSKAWELSNPRFPTYAHFDSIKTWKYVLWYQNEQFAHKWYVMTHFQPSRYYQPWVIYLVKRSSYISNVRNIFLYPMSDIIVTSFLPPNIEQASFLYFIWLQG